MPRGNLWVDDVTILMTIDLFHQKLDQRLNLLIFFHYTPFPIVFRYLLFTCCISHTPFLHCAIPRLLCSAFFIGRTGVELKAVCKSCILGIISFPPGISIAGASVALVLFLSLPY